MKKILFAIFFILNFNGFAEAQTPAPSLTNAVTSARDVNPNDCSGTITAGGTAQYLIPNTSDADRTKIKTVRGLLVMNVDTTAEGLCVSFTGVIGAATCSSTGYFYLQAATSTAAGGSYSSPLGFGTNKNPVIVAATTGHKFSCSYW